MNPAIKSEHIQKKLEEHKLEQYYPGDDKWAHFTSLSADIRPC